jgi:hypothetical protein
VLPAGHRHLPLGDKPDEADSLIRLGDAFQAAGDADAAHGVWHEALAILDDLNHPEADDLRDRLELSPTSGLTRR